MSELRELLTGGDRRSIARSNRVLELARGSARRIEEIASLCDDEDWLVMQRALDLLEKLAHEDPTLIQPHRKVFLGPHADSDKWEIRLQIVRALPLLRWTPRERQRVMEILIENVDYPQTFVRAWALDSLATFSEKDLRLTRIVRKKLREFEQSDSKALQARARHIRARLEPAAR